MSSVDWNKQFESRKRDHIRYALDPSTQTAGASGLESVELIHEALPDLNFNEVDIATELFGHKMASPLFISSMTAGHQEGFRLNLDLAQACARKKWIMGVGSQRRELTDSQAASEWAQIRDKVPDVLLMGNIGLSQLIETASSKIQKLVDQLQAVAMIVHTNPLQECLQPEGSPEFRGGLDALKRLVSEISVPVILKETGCGFSKSTLTRLMGSGVYAVDMAGLGGTHWGRVEGHRSPEGSRLHKVSESFANWGVATVTSVMEAKQLKPDYQIWASGGVRTGVDAAKLIALGASQVGLAKPMMEAALKGVDAIVSLMDLLEYELRVALFCTGAGTIHQLGEKQVWHLR